MGIAGEPKYPATAPDAAALTGLAATLDTQDKDFAKAEAALCVLRQTQGKTRRGGTRGDGRGGHCHGDLIYGANDARKGNFGLPPALSRGNGVLDKLPIDALCDGHQPRQPVPEPRLGRGRGYQAQSALDSDMEKHGG